MKKIILILLFAGVSCFAANFQRASDTTQVCIPSEEEGFCVTESGWKYHKIEKEEYKYPGYMGAKYNTSSTAYDPQREKFKHKKRNIFDTNTKNCSPSSAFARCD